MKHETPSVGVNMKNPILSIHIPKTGGTTFRNILQKGVTNKLFLDYFKRNDKAFYGGVEVKADLSALLTMPDLDGCTVIHGHYPVSKHLGRFNQPKIITWMRHPVERVASEYFYYKRRQFPTNPLWVKTINDNLSLEQFGALPEVGNLQSQYMDGVSTENFDFIGITENFNNSMSIFSKTIFNVPIIEFSTSNANVKKRNMTYELDDSVRKVLLNYNLIDYAKYQKALEFHYAAVENM